MIKKELLTGAYEIARKRYASIGVDTDEAIKNLDAVKISLHCWQGDDVGGFETPEAELAGGGIQVTGNYPGKAGNINELRQDFEEVTSLLPGNQRINLHAIYGDFKNEHVDRNRIETRHFQSWIDWARKNNLGIDFNPTCFSHPYANDGFTLSSKNETCRKFWVEHVKRCRLIAADIGKQLNDPVINNIWIPDGSKDIPVDRYTHRNILKKSLDEIFEVDYPGAYLKDSLESKLFGIGSEAMVVGSHEFYLAYALKKNKLLCLDNGHYHPTEQVGDKISAILVFLEEILLHITRGVRWDSDHVVTFNDETLLIAQEVVRADALNRVHVGLDYFDGSINRIGAYVIGARAAQQAFLYALLEPLNKLKEIETSGKYFERLGMLELQKTMPFGAVYDYYCMKNNVPVGEDYIIMIQQYEEKVLKNRR